MQASYTNKLTQVHTQNKEYNIDKVVSFLCRLDVIYLNMHLGVNLLFRGNLRIKRGYLNKRA